MELKITTTEKENCLLKKKKQPNSVFPVTYFQNEGGWVAVGIFKSKL
jgi:hypothetical protein